jgi:hypothetical protein
MLKAARFSEHVNRDGARIMNTLPITQRRLMNAKIAYTPRNVDLETATGLLSGDDVVPNAGDLVLARIEKIGQHGGLELAHGRRATLFVDDEIVVCYGNRYAPDQFEAEVPSDLGPCDLVAGGGIAARAISSHACMKAPTKIVPIGLLVDNQNQRINLSSAALPELVGLRNRPYTLAVVGTSMNAGKTTTAANLIRGLVSAGRVVGAAKVTGTGSGRDTWFMKDAGPKLTLDFTHAGFPSTYLATPAEVEGILDTLTGHLTNAGVDVIVLEVADGLYQDETAALLVSQMFSRLVDSVIFAAGDAMGAKAGVEWLRGKQLPVKAVSGLLTASPLAIIEAATATGLPTLGKKALLDPSIVSVLGIPSRVSPLRCVATGKETSATPAVTRASALRPVARAPVALAYQ